MKTLTHGLGIVGGVTCLLPLTLLYAFGLLFLIPGAFFGTDPFLSKLGTVTIFLLPGFSLYALWRLLFNVDARLHPVDADAAPPAFPPSLWMGIVIGVFLSIYICAAATGNAVVVCVFGTPALVALALLGLYVRTDRDAAAPSTSVQEDLSA